MGMHRIAAGAVAGLLATTLAGCTTSPANYAASLSPADPKWRSPECQQMRIAARDYEARQKKTMGWGTGLMFGPYGLGMALAGKEHQEKLRKAFARDMHLQCSSQPVPGNLQVDLPPRTRI